MAGLSEDSTDIFLSQISMLTDWDVWLLQECFRKLDGVNVGTHELFTPCQLMGGLRCPRSEQMDCSWTDDYHLSPVASQEKEIGGVRVGFDGNPGFREWETQTTCDPGWRLQCEPVRIDRLSPCGRVDPNRPRTLLDMKRFTARESFAHCCGRAGLGGDEHLDGRRLTSYSHVPFGRILQNRCHKWTSS